MISLILLEVLVIGTLAYLFAYFYSELSWQKLTNANSSKSKQTHSLPRQSDYKTDGVVY